MSIRDMRSIDVGFIRLSSMFVSKRSDVWMAGLEVGF